MNWYKLDAIRDALRLDYGAELAPGIVREGQPHLEVWRRTVGREVFTTFLSYESDELLVPEEQLLAAAESLDIEPARARATRLTRSGAFMSNSTSSSMTGSLTPA